MKTNIPEELQQTIEQLYTSCWGKTPGINPVTILHIHADYTLIASGQEATPENIWLLGIGSEKTSQEFFTHNPPTPGEVEEAIQTVEDEVMTLSKLLPAGSALYTADKAIRQIALLKDRAENTTEIILSRPDMEQIFGRLAAIISGRPASSDILPSDNAFAATLLILREVMFHLKFTEIRIV
jgi:exopolyphosphatase/pppGpp-phosphohydrolase